MDSRDYETYISLFKNMSNFMKKVRAARSYRCAIVNPSENAPAVRIRLSLECGNGNDGVCCHLPGFNVVSCMEPKPPVRFQMDSRS